MINIHLNPDSISKKIEVHSFDYLFSKYVLSTYYVPNTMLVFGEHENERNKFCLHNTHSLEEKTFNTIN